MTIRIAVLTLLGAVPGLARAATPEEGVEQKLRYGFFTEVNLGTFWDINFKPPGGEGAFSNAEPYLQLGLGYDITPRIAVGIQLGLGASSALCFMQISNQGDCVPQPDSAGNTQLDANGNPVVVPANFSNTFIQAQVTYSIPLYDRLNFTPRFIIGYQNLSPAPLWSGADPTTAINGGFMVGGDLAIEYATHQDHFFVGVDFEPRFVIGPNILSMALFPHVKYTF